MKRILYRLAFTAAFLLLTTYSLKAQSDLSMLPRAFTAEDPLIYEDAWDLWPYVFLDDNGEPTGYNVEMLKMIFEELGIAYEIHLKPTQQALEDLRSHRSDLMLGMVAHFHDDYTRYYGKNIIHLFTHSIAHNKNETQVARSLEDLVHQKIIVHDGSFSHHQLKSRGLGDNAIPYGDIDKAIQMISTEGQGQVLWNTMSLKWLIHKYHADNLELSPIDMPSGDYRFMANDTVLLKMLDDAYTRLKMAGQFQPLEAKWFYPEEQESHSSPAWLWYIVAAICFITLSLIVASLAYHFRERKATSEGRLRTNRLKLILNTCHVRIWTYDLQKKNFTWYGDYTQQMRSLSPGEFAKHYPADDFDRLMAAIKQVAEQHQNEVEIEVMTRKDTENGEYRSFVANLSVLRNEKGLPRTVIVAMNDITERRLKQQRSEEVMHRYRAMFDTAMVDMVYYDSGGHIVNMNERAQDTFNTNEAEAKYKLPILWKSIEVRDFDYYHVTQFIDLANGYRQVSANTPGDKMCYELQLVSIHDANHKLAGIYGTGRDVTEMANNFHRARKGVQELTDVNNELAANVNNINYTLEVGKIRMINYSPQTHLLTINHRIHEAKYVLTQQRCLQMADQASQRKLMHVFRVMDRLSNTPIDCDISTRLRLPGGKKLCLLAHIFPVLAPDGSVKEYAGICRDTTVMKHTEMMLQQETAKAQEVEQVKSQFLHNMCYEIRTPLDTVVALAEKFEQEQDAVSEQVNIEQIKEHTAYLLNLVNDILFLSRLDARMVESKPLPCDFAQTFPGHCYMGWGDVVKNYVKLVIESHYDQLEVCIDDANLGRIIEQVMKNAVEHTNEGAIHARYDYIGGKLVISIDDTGSGIDAETLEHAFDRFNLSSGKSHSTGLGLPICKELASLLGGTIDIASEVGKGTTVWITIPCEATTIKRKKEL